jgi:uncharacterized membrane protein YheB (UPF0754 family)
LKFAKDREKHDSFSNARLFSEEEYQTVDQKGLRELIGSTQHLIENVEFRETIKQYVSLDKLKELIVNLMLQYGEREQERLRKIWLNDLIKDIKSKLKLKTATTPPTDINIYQLALNRNKV